MPTQITDFSSGRSRLLVESSKGLKVFSHAFLVEVRYSFQPGIEGHPFCISGMCCTCQRSSAMWSVMSPCPFLSSRYEVILVIWLWKEKSTPGCIWVCSRWGETVSGSFSIQTIILLASFFFFYVDSVLDLFHKLTWTPGWIFPFSRIKWRSSLFLTFEETSGLLCLAVVFSVFVFLFPPPFAFKLVNFK